MTQKTKGPAAGTAEPLKTIGTLERTDKMNSIFWQLELQSKAKGTKLSRLLDKLEPGCAYGLLMYLNGGAR